ncbi:MULTISPECIES: hypothetical protein [Spiroplasma]|uniref:Transmembrane protein n=1 Tax=Spiroplasma ixodetis TaxID=2141 RepID=A0ABN6T4X6_9MOLU|nr:MULTISPECIES: hypothetical protein [Spiroplasma]TLF25844.1 MAG: hypothetical protein FCO83_02210 [Spiroplasma sp. WSS]WDA54131.1 MAG: hypothetical protein PPFGHCPK_00561 [Spiroplasma endosymbiont of Drosophila atripex]BDT04569.1 hypothetical protein SHM_22150 [Spiroplasma ixodetis]
MKSLKLLTLPKILMLIGAVWIIVFSLLYAAGVITYSFYGWNENGATLVIIGIIYILIPFSVKPGLWSRLWALFISFLSVIIVIGLFVGKDVDYKSTWTYINALPHIIMAFGSILWIFNSK